MTIELKISELELVKNYEKKYGYIPTTEELRNLYYCGGLNLTNAEEDELLEFLEQH